MRKPKARYSKKQARLSEVEEIRFLDEWLQSQKPESGSNPLSLPAAPPGAPPVSRSADGDFPSYAGSTRFEQLPISQKTKDGLDSKNYTVMSAIQRASLPHTLCGRDVLGAAKTGSGKTLAFVIPVLEKLYRARWGPEDGVGCIIMSPTRELAGQLFEELKHIGKYHSFSAGLLIGGRRDVDTEKKRVSDLNILVCTPGRLLQHMDETENFECSQLQILVLDEADRILDVGFKKAVNAIISQLPKRRQTLLFSATQGKSVQDLARLSLKDPEYLSVHAESITATPKRLRQYVITVPLDQKLDMLWSFIKTHLNSKILVFLSSCKQVKFVYEAFKKLRPGIPLKCLHGRMKQERRMGIYFQFCEKRSVLFSTDVAARGLDFPAVDWVVQVDCPEDTASYIHRVGRTARFTSGGSSILFLTPSEEEKMIEKLKAAKITLLSRTPKAQRMQSISGLLAALLVKYPDMQHLAQRAFITYLRSIYLQRDKEVFDVLKLPVEEFAASLGLPMTPKVRFLSQKSMGKKTTPKETPPEQENDFKDVVKVPQKKLKLNEPMEEAENDILLAKEEATLENEQPISATRVLKKKKKKLKINMQRPVGTRVVFDEEGNTLPPLAALADANSGDGGLQLDKVKERYKKLQEEMKLQDKEDKLLHRQRLRERRIKDKLKLKRGRVEEEHEQFGSDKEVANSNAKRSKIYFESDSDGEGKKRGMDDSISLAEQEELALKLLSSMHS